MNPTIIGMIVFTCALGGALSGMWLRTALPGHHLDDSAKDTVKLGIGLISVMTALVLGLVTASAKSSYDAMDKAVKDTAVDILVLDRTLARYGSETAEIRKSLKNLVGVRIDVIWPQDSSKPANLDPIHSDGGLGAEGLAHAIRGLKPSDGFQQSLRSRALDLVEALLQTRWIVARTETAIPFLFLGILMFWLTIIFLSFGLFAPRNATLIVFLIVCAMSVGAAVFLLLEMGTPFDGLLKISADPLRYAFQHLNQ
jgi:hypothetical protein